MAEEIWEHPNRPLQTYQSFVSPILGGHTVTYIIFKNSWHQSRFKKNENCRNTLWPVRLRGLFYFLFFGNCVPRSHLWLNLRFSPLISWIAYDLSWLFCLAHLDSPMMLFHFLSLLASAPSILFNKCKFLLGDSRWFKIPLDSLEIRCSIWHVLP